MAIEIAIIDDMERDRNLLHTNLDMYLEQKGIAYTVEEYSSGESFLSEFEGKKYDMIFLDMYMTGITGMETAQKIREKDENCRIIFLTCSMDYILEGYTVNASHYLLKPLTEDGFEQAMKNCSQVLKQKKEMITVESKGTKLDIDISKIYYIDIEKRKVQIHTKENVIAVKGSFRSVTEQLNDQSRFLLSIQGVLVNMDKIVEEEDGMFLLKNHETVPINLRGRRGIINQYYQYVFHHMRSGS